MKTVVSIGTLLKTDGNKRAFTIALQLQTFTRYIIFENKHLGKLEVKHQSRVSIFIIQANFHTSAADDF